MSLFTTQQGQRSGVIGEVGLGVAGSWDKGGKENDPISGRGPFPSLFRAKVQGNRKGGDQFWGGATSLWRAHAESESWVQVSRCPSWVALRATHPLWALVSSSVK